MTTTVNLPASWDDKQWNRAIGHLKKSFAPGSKLMLLLADSAVQALLHAYNHGDAIRCEQLYLSVGESAGAVRGESMKEWFRVMSGGQITAAKNKDQVRVWKMQKGWKKDAFTLDQALSKPFWEFMGEEKVRFVTGASLLATVKQAVKRAEKAHDKGEFKGDYDKVSAVLSVIASFADSKFKGLTELEMGEVDPIESEDPQIDPATIPDGPVSQHPSREAANRGEATPTVN